MEPTRVGSDKMFSILNSKEIHYARLTQFKKQPMKYIYRTTVLYIGQG